MKQITHTEEAHAMKAKVTRTKIAVATGIAVLAAGLANPLAGGIIPGKGATLLA